MLCWGRGTSDLCTQPSFSFAIAMGKLTTKFLNPLFLFISLRQTFSGLEALTDFFDLSNYWRKLVMPPRSSIKHIPAFRRDNTEKNVREMFIMVLFINKYILKEIIKKRKTVYWYLFNFFKILPTKMEVSRNQARVCCTLNYIPSQNSSDSAMFGSSDIYCILK